MLRIYDESDWRRRRRLILMSLFAAGSLFGGLMGVTAPAGSNALAPNAVPPPAADTACGGTRLKLSCKLSQPPR